jgi:hypothetical protein
VGLKPTTLSNTTGDYMKNLENQVKAIIKSHKSMMKANPLLSSTWWHINDIDVDTLEEYARKHKIMKYYNYCDIKECMKLQVTHLPSAITLFMNSKPCKIEVTVTVVK